MTLTPDQLHVIRAEAGAVVKMVCRAEAKAQATIAKKEMVDKANEVFKRIEGRLEAMEARLARLEDARGRLGDAVCRLTVLADVLVDIAVCDKQTLAGPTANRRKYFEDLCDCKKAEFEATGKA